MSELASNPIAMTHVSAKFDFVVNEFPRIKVPPQKKGNLKDFGEMNTIQRELIGKRLIERVNDL